jgi:hypothetical protein
MPFTVAGFKRDVVSMMAVGERYCRAGHGTVSVVMAVFKSCCSRNFMVMAFSVVDGGAGNAGMDMAMFVAARCYSGMVVNMAAAHFLIVGIVIHPKSPPRILIQYYLMLVTQ